MARTSAVIYLRVSTEKQARSGLGREAQEATCRAYAERQGWTVAGVFVDDGVTGKLEERPAFLAALAAQRANDAAFLVYAVSRFARTQRQTWNLVDDRGEYRIPLVSATEPFDTSTPMGRAFLGMLATFAALESDLASERTRDALAAARKRGVRLGAPGMVTTVPVDVLRRIQSDPRSLRAVAESLNNDGIPAAKGGRWYAHTVKAAKAVSL